VQAGGPLGRAAGVFNGLGGVVGGREVMGQRLKVIRPQRLDGLAEAPVEPAAAAAAHAFAERSRDERVHEGVRFAALALHACGEGDAR